MPDAAQESKTEPIGAKVTPTEKAAIEAVRDDTGRPVSELLREYTIAELVRLGSELLKSTAA